MFQRLNKMLMGEIDSLSSQEPEFSEKEDDEWILVDFIDTCTNCSVEEADVVEASATDSSPVFSCLSSPLEHLPEDSESCFIQFESCPMEESWFITPPPCFTAGGLTTIKVETSPMENLLIEHPSMSVYAVHNTCHSLNETGCADEEFHSPGSPRAKKSCLRHTGTVSTTVLEQCFLFDQAASNTASSRALSAKAILVLGLTFVPNDYLIKPNYFCFNKPKCYVQKNY
ncbi:tumor protein p53-inducible nuclear protein 1 isoform X4 [Lonchura striata]|uniref:tumor protein p53-inducible nuclear protein 1 isoform X4 n=1 Tax=Lonchura striata TaxID=40157 RepID=UPI000B4CC72B|nr:tumor protein p53-inducible nuclear protein 1 isoform X4 [Lonchura striata domestica]